MTSGSFRREVKLVQKMRGENTQKQTQHQNTEPSRYKHATPINDTFFLIFHVGVELVIHVYQNEPWQP